MTNTLLQKPLTVVALLACSLAFGESAYDPRGLHVAVRTINDDVTIQTYVGNDANGIPQYIYSTTYDNDYAVGLYFNGELVAEEPVMEDDANPVAKANRIEVELQNLVARGELATVTQSSGGWIWAQGLGRAAWISAPTPSGSAGDLIDPRATYVARKFNSLQIWSGDRPIAVENLGSERDAYKKWLRLRSSQLQSCREQRLLQLHVTPQSWVWLQPTPDPMLNPGIRNNYVITSDKKSLQVYRDGKVLFLEWHGDGKKDEVWQKHFNLQSQLLDACRRGRSIDVLQSNDRRWVWLDVAAATQVETSSHGTPRGLQLVRSKFL